MSKNSKIIYLILSSIFFIFFNSYFTNFILSEGGFLPQNPVFEITYIQNQGAAFNILNGYKIFLIAFSATAILMLIFYAIKQIKNISVFGLFFISFLLSGIFNNMYERIFFGYVRDFIKLNFVDFPIFNLSDIFINIGVIGLIIIIIKNNYFKK